MADWPMHLPHSCCGMQAADPHCWVHGVAGGAHRLGRGALLVVALLAIGIPVLAALVVAAGAEVLEEEAGEGGEAVKRQP